MNLREKWESKNTSKITVVYSPGYNLSLKVGNGNVEKKYTYSYYNAVASGTSSYVSISLIEQYWPIRISSSTTRITFTYNALDNRIMHLTCSRGSNFIFQYLDDSSKVVIAHPMQDHSIDITPDTVATVIVAAIGLTAGYKLIGADQLYFKSITEEFIFY